MGTVPFNIYPSSNRVPGVFVEVNPQVSIGTVNQQTLLMGQMLSSGTATAGQPLLSTGQTDAEVSCGVGSQLANMLAAYRANDPFGTVYLLPLADESGATAGVQTITITGPATANGTLALYVAGTPVPVGIASADTATAMAANVATAINANPRLPCTAAAASGVVTVTARNKGVSAADIDIRTNYYGKAGSEVMPAGVIVAVASTAAGATDPSAGSISAALANLSDQPFDFIVNPWSGAAELGAVSTFLDDQAGRWSWEQELLGHAFTAVRGTVSTLTTWSSDLNDQHLSALGVAGSPSPAYIWAAAFAATVATSVRADPSLPLQNVQIQAVLAPPVQDRFDISERNTLLYAGVGVARTNDAGQIILDRSVTTWRIDLSGAVSEAYLDTETLYQLMAVIRDLRSDLGQAFARKKLVADGTRVPGGSNWTTPSMIKNHVVGEYTRLADSGLVQDVPTFTAGLVVENAGHGQVSILYPAILSEQLRVISVNLNFAK